MFQTIILQKIKTSAMCLVLILTILSAAISQVQAAGTNQNDLGYNTDLPTHTQSCPNNVTQWYVATLFWYPDWGIRCG